MAADSPLKGLRVLELAGLAPGLTFSIAPFCGLLLASYGASVLRIDRPHPLAHPPPQSRQSTSISHLPPSSSSSSLPLPPPTPDLLTTHKSSICLDLKHAPSVALLLSLVTEIDILIDPFRPGVLENLNLDPSTVLLRRNLRIIVARLTGFRRDGKYRDMAGHDINYLAVSGVLSLLGSSPGRPPEPPGNILADFAGGGLMAFCGILLALLRRGVTGKGQVVQANMVDGVGFLATFPRLALKTPLWDGERGTNLLDGGAPFYRCYQTKEKGEFVAVGALEQRFFDQLLKGLRLTETEVLPPGFKGGRNDKDSWAFMAAVLEKRFREKTRSEWEAIFDTIDACVTPVLEMAELERTGYEQRPLVGLRESPAQAVKDQWHSHPLRPGERGEARLEEWLGWRRGRDFDAVAVEGGTALAKLERSKL